MAYGSPAELLPVAGCVLALTALVKCMTGG
jgi:hypothetical protein